MSLSLEKVNRRQNKKAPRPKASPVKAKSRTRPWTPVETKPLTAPTEPKAPKTSRASKPAPSATSKLKLAKDLLKAQLEEPLSLKFMGVELEVGKKIRLHLPPLKRKG